MPVTEASGNAISEGNAVLPLLTINSVLPAGAATAAAGDVTGKRKKESKAEDVRAKNIDGFKDLRQARWSVNLSGNLAFFMPIGMVPCLYLNNEFFYLGNL